MEGSYLSVPRGMIVSMEITRGEVACHPGHVFVPRGETALTRALLARGALRVVRKNRGRKEQIGVAATREAIEEAQREVAESAPRRAEARERSRERRAEDEKEYRESFARELVRLFPAIPEEDRTTVVLHTCEVSSGRVGRTARAKVLAEEPIRLAVRAHIRHEHTDYDARLRRAGFGQRFGRASREDRDAARKAVKRRIDAIFALWSGERVEVPAAAPVAPLAPAASPDAPRAQQLHLWQRPLG
jgi:hypothetical protein